MKYERILIVDDSGTSRLIVKRCFEMAGFSDATFIESTDGVAALDVLRSKQIDLVVTDIKMPKMDGLTLVRKIRSVPQISKIPVVIISSVADAAQNDEVFQTDVVALIQKPLSPAKLIHALEE